MMRAASVLLVTIGCGLLGLSPARAAVFTHTVTIPSTSADWLNQVVFPQYDPINGSLERVTISVSGTISGQVGVENIEDKFNLIMASLAATLRLYDDQAASVLTLNLSQTGNVVVDPFDGDIDYDGASGYPFTTLTASGSASDAYQNYFGDDLSRFIGTGNIIYTGSLANASSASAGFGTPEWFSTVFGGATFQITYESAVVPEPASLMSVSMVLALAMLVRRARRDQGRKEGFT